MATAQGKVKVSGVDTPGVYYTALFHRAGSVTQWRRVVRLTDNTGVYQVAISEDNFMGTNFVAQNGDKLVVLFWRDTTQAPAKSPGEAYENQSIVDGTAGDHEVGFKYDNGANAVANYSRANQYAAIVFNVTGDAWNATPDGGGIGDVNGNVTLQTNLGPSAVLAGLSTDPGNPTDITRLIAEALNNTSGDNENRVVTANGEIGQLYSQFGQILFQAISAAHNPTGGAQTADGSDIDGSRYRLFTGLEYGNVFGTIIAGAGGTLDGADQVHYPGPSFQNHTHTWPHIDIYQIRLTTKDDAGIDIANPPTNPALTAVDDFYVRTTYRAPGLVFGAREWASWTDHVANSGSPVFSAANPNTVRDVVRIDVNPAGLDNPITAATRYQDAVGATNGIVAIGGQPSHVAIKNDPWSAGLIYGRFASDVDFSGAVADQLTVNSTGIGLGIQAGDLAVGDIPGFLNIISQTPLGGGVGQPILHSYRIISAPGNDAIIVEAGGSLQTYSDSDWWFISNEPGGGNRSRWEWEVDESGAGWTDVGKPYQQLGGVAVGPGTTINKTGIGEGVWPGMWLHVLNGGRRGWYQIGAVPNDDSIELVPGDSLPGVIAAADTIAIGFPSKPMKWPQRDNDALNFRIAYQYTNGWSQTLGQYWEMDRSSAPVLTDNGSVNNIDPEPVIPVPVPVAGNSTTYTFDGRESYGTQVTSWIQGGPLGADIPTVNGGTIPVGASVAFSDPALDSTNLRDNGHAVLILTDVGGLITRVFPVVDINHSDNTQVFLDTTSLGAPLNYSVGQNFRTANDYEIEAGGNANDIASYSWVLRSNTTPLPPLGVNDPAFPAWWAAARADATGTGSTFLHTYPQGDDGRIAVIQLIVTDEDASPGGNSPGTDSKYLSFVVDVTPGGGPAGGGLRRIEWD